MALTHGVTMIRNINENKFCTHFLERYIQKQFPVAGCTLRQNIFCIIVEREIFAVMLHHEHLIAKQWAFRQSSDL